MDPKKLISLIVRMRTNRGSTVCTKQIFDRLLRMQKEVFLENFLQRFVALIFALLLVPFESKLVNFWIHRQCLKTSRKSMILSLLKRIGQKRHISMNLQGLTEAMIIVQFLPKRYQKERKC